VPDVPRWVKVCQQCFEEEFPSEYCPDLTDYDNCSNCGQEALVCSVNPRDFKEAQA
jgi:rRNA maturation endonuclease Nob1